MPKGKNGLQRQNEAQANFDLLLEDLSKTKERDFKFDTYEDVPDEISVSICNTNITLKSDGTYVVEQ